MRNKTDLIKYKNLLNTYLNVDKYSIDDQKAVIIRTLPNLEDEITCRDYNTKHNAFFSNEAVRYLRTLGVKHLVVDLPSIDKFEDGGSLGNHQIFWD